MFNLLKLIDFYFIRFINAISASKLPRSVTIDEMREATRSDLDSKVLLKLIGKE